MKKNIYKTILILLGILLILLIFLGNIVERYFSMRTSMVISASIPLLFLIFIVLFIFLFINRKKTKK